jgi:hypothetical protein
VRGFKSRALEHKGIIIIGHMWRPIRNSPFLFSLHIGVARTNIVQKSKLSFDLLVDLE